MIDKLKTEIRNRLLQRIGEVMIHDNLYFLKDPKVNFMHALKEAINIVENICDSMSFEPEKLVISGEEKIHAVNLPHCGRIGK